MPTVIITKRSDGKIAIRASYNTDFSREAKKRGALWEKPSWLFDGRDEPWVRALCMKLYGTDGTDSVPMCTLRVKSPSGREATRGPVEIHGRPLAMAQAKEHGGGARLGEGVVLEEGELRKGGSVNNWKTVITRGTVLLVRDFIRSWAEKLQAEHPDEYEIVEEAPVVNLIALTEERKRLLARTAEIDALLAGAGAHTGAAD